MNALIRKFARYSALIGGITLTTLAFLMTLSIVGGSIAKIAHSDWLNNTVPTIASAIQASGIRTIPGMYEVMTMGMAFVLFSFLPIAQYERGHAVVDLFTNFLPVKSNQLIMALWETIFFVALLLISWRLWFGMERLMSSGVLYQDLQLPKWWGYAVAFVQMALACLVAAHVCIAEWISLVKGRGILPSYEGAMH